MVECERVAGGRPTMQDHLLVMVLAETLTSAESTALTFDFTHTHSTTCTDIICYQHLILNVFVIMSYSLLIARTTATILWHSSSDCTSGFYGEIPTQ